jgi:hypothetical protein
MSRFLTSSEWNGTCSAQRELCSEVRFAVAWVPQGPSLETIDNVLTRLRSEFLEMPCLRLTPAQVQRLCGIEPTLCLRLLKSLVDAKFLRVSSDGRYARLTDGELAHPRRARADLRPAQHLAQASRTSEDATLMEGVGCSG